MTFEKQTFANGRAVLYLGDCLDLKSAGLLKADAVVSDPPYGIGYQHGGTDYDRKLMVAIDGTISSSISRSKIDTIHGDDKPFDPVPWLDYPRILLWGADHFRARLPEGGKFLCWDKSVGQGPADSFADAEFAWTNLPTIKRTVHRQLWKGFACSSADATRKGVPRYHVSQKPRELMRWCIETLKMRMDSLILDPYMGSGSTGIAALSLGHRFVGVEIDRKHFDTACKRVEEASMQIGLFGISA